MIKKIIVGDLQTNCYIVSKNKDCVIIDAGDNYEKINNYVVENGLKICGILLTHGHFDHCASCSKFQKNGIKIYIHKLDADKLYTDGNLANLMNISFEKFKADVLIDEGELKIGPFTFDVIHTPGHSNGGVSYIYEDNIFCGDTLFEFGIGRYDFYDGSLTKLQQSIKNLIEYKNNGYKLFYGH